MSTAADGATAPRTLTLSSGGSSSTPPHMAAHARDAAAITMQLDLAFDDPAVERAFRAHAADGNRRTALLSEIVRLFAWAIIALRLAAHSDGQGALLAAAGAASSVGLVAWRASRCATLP